ncbi:hypothetical protein D9758_012980 [Tetrapyrgos nigripes]|uniref:Hydrophobin n=1 Tax=Tetrapyrgos nigripes TaxID=182062 RepID=A0A8H5CKT9_9AGAR|nr:hypothetical protein D9758_012980 [Tetrapyrgos nigripes]
MFHRASTILVASLAATLAVAAPTSSSGGQCNVGPLQCCNSVQSAQSPSVASLAGLLGIVLDPITGLVGLNCDPINVLGIGGNNCAAQPVCCTGNKFGGLIALGCSPINVGI